MVTILGVHCSLWAYDRSCRGEGRGRAVAWCGGSDAAPLSHRNTRPRAASKRDWVRRAMRVSSILAPLASEFKVCWSGGSTRGSRGRCGAGRGCGARGPVAGGAAWLSAVADVEEIFAGHGRGRTWFNVKAAPSLSPNILESS